MKEYHKIVTVWKRNPENNFKTLLHGKWAEPEFEYLKDVEWVCTEKVDGTNIRVMFNDDKVTFGGKTDNAQLFAPLVERLQSLFYEGAMSRIFNSPVCLYGEGFGAKIQKGGGNYLSGVDFVLFDVLAGDTWLERHNVQDIANKLECGIVPIVMRSNLWEAIECAQMGFKSTWGDFESEGLVMRPAVELKTRTGKRIITKIKHKDFQ